MSSQLSTSFTFKPVTCRMEIHLGKMVTYGISYNKGFGGGWVERL